MFLVIDIDCESNSMKFFNSYNILEELYLQLLELDSLPMSKIIKILRYFFLVKKLEENICN